MVFKVYKEAEANYRAKLDDLTAKRAHPVIQRVHDDTSNDFKNILVPFSNGRKTIQVSASIEDSVATEGKSVMKALEKRLCSR